jgi:hypothetical protein
MSEFKPDVLKTKSTSNIQVIEFENEMFETFKQAKFEDEQLISYFLFQFQFCTITKCGLASTTTFHK